MSEPSCPYRFNERHEDGETVATCGLAQQLMQIEDSNACAVSIDACQACVAATPVAGRFINSIFPSILNSACDAYLQRETSVTNDHAKRISRLCKITEESLVQENSNLLTPPASCDVVLFCTDSTASTRNSVKSVLEQSDATVYLHLVVADTAAEPLVETYRAIRGM